MAAKKTASTTSRPSTRPATPATASSAPAAPVSTTPVRNTPIPRPQSSPSSFQKKQPTPDQIAKRAYEIWQSGKGGSQQDNWYRAERELRGL